MIGSVVSLPSSEGLLSMIGFSPRLPLARIACVTALLLPIGAAPLLGMLHLASVRHAMCLEHGELIEVAQSNQAESAESTPGWTADATRSDADLHGHHHCEVVPQRLNPNGDGKSAASPAIDSSSAIAIGGPAVGTMPPAIAILLLAPKASPPVSA